jgi:hypothetical protein
MSFQRCVVFKSINLIADYIKEELVKNLCANQYIDNKSQNAMKEVNKLGGAKVILCNRSNWKGDD